MASHACVRPDVFPNERARGLAVQGERGVPTRKYMEELATEVGIKAREFAKLFAAVSTSIDRWRSIAKQAGVDAETARRVELTLAGRKLVVA